MIFHVRVNKTFVHGCCLRNGEASKLAMVSQRGLVTGWKVLKLSSTTTTCQAGYKCKTMCRETISILPHTNRSGSEAIGKIAKQVVFRANKLTQMSSKVFFSGKYMRKVEMGIFYVMSPIGKIKSKCVYNFFL